MEPRVKAFTDNRKKVVKWQYLLYMSLQYGELQPTNVWDLLANFEHPIKFQRVSRLGFVTAPTSLNGGQQNFARCLAISCTGILYMHLWGLLPRNGILPAAKFSLEHGVPISITISNTISITIFCTVEHPFEDKFSKVGKRGVPLCRKSRLKSCLKCDWNRHTMFHCAENRDWDRDWNRHSMFYCAENRNWKKYWYFNRRHLLTMTTHFECFA